MKLSGEKEAEENELIIYWELKMGEKKRVVCMFVYPGGATDPRS